ncbi:hypothetical protein JB92DRAFT_2986417 [Gautieria morchelliformis]|nr:hypothetical protein JB92DRAFT_2986417 [Gautieria morchelliformis]
MSAFWTMSEAATPGVLAFSVQVIYHKHRTARGHFHMIMCWHLEVPHSKVAQSLRSKKNKTPLLSMPWTLI